MNPKDEYQSFSNALNKNDEILLSDPSNHKNKYYQLIKSMKTHSNYKNFIMKTIENPANIKEVFNVLKALYSEYLRLLSNNMQLDDHLSLIKSIVGLIVKDDNDYDNYYNDKTQIIKNIQYNTNQSLLKILLMLMVIYTKHNQFDRSLLNNFINLNTKGKNTNHHLSLYYIKEVLKNEGIKGNIEDITLIKSPKKNKAFFCFKILDYLPKEFYRNQILPTNIKISSMTELVAICQDNYQAKYVTKDTSCQTLRGDKPISSAIGIYYYEIKVISSKSISAIGIIDKDFNLQSKLPGMELNSIGYHSYDGNAYIFNKPPIKYGPQYSNKDYVGCCINFIDKTIFFTVNGIKLSNISINLNLNEYYPAVCMTMYQQEVQINFGQWPFCFDLALYKSDKIKQYYEQIINTIIPIEINYDLLIKDYLIYNGYAATYTEFLRETEFHNNNDMMLESFNDYKVDIRKEIHYFIQIRDFDSLRRVIIAHFIEFTDAFIMIDFYQNILIALKNLSNENKGFNTFDFIAYLKKEIIQVKEYEILKNIMPICDEIIRECFHVVIYSKEKAIEIVKDIIEKYLNHEYLFSLINKSLLKNNYNGINDNELDCIVKQLLLIFTEGVKHKQIKIKFLLSNDDCFDQMNKILIKKKITTSDILLEKTINEYFAHMTI